MQGDPDEDVEADRVRSELEPEIHARVRREVPVRGLVDRVRDEHPVHEGPGLKDSIGERSNKSNF